jgi:hypothetical protein
MVCDEGLRFGGVTRLPLRQSMYSVESCDAQNSRSAPSVLNFGRAFFIVTDKDSAVEDAYAIFVSIYRSAKTHSRVSESQVKNPARVSR